MDRSKNWFNDFTPFYEFNGNERDEDNLDLVGENVCEDLDEEECRTIAQAVDLTLIMAALECTEDDMRDAIDKLFQIYDGVVKKFTHVCFNGAKIKVKLNEKGELEIETEPEVDIDL